MFVIISLDVKIKGLGYPGGLAFQLGRSTINFPCLYFISDDAVV